MAQAAGLWADDLVSASDTFLKPLFLGRGVQVPMLVILLGVIGGMLLSGIIGLFVGAVVLSLGYKIFQALLEPETPSDQQGDFASVLPTSAKNPVPTQEGA